MARMNPPKPRVPTEAELERARQVQQYREELDAMFPERGWRQLYSCNFCGVAVIDRVVHLNTAHGGSRFLEMLKELFDEDESP